MVAYWRLGLAAVSVVAVYFLTQPVMEVVLLAVRRRIGKRYRWVADIHRHLLVYISWITMCLFFLLIASSLLDLGRDNGLVRFISYVIIVPIVLASFALRVVVTNMVVRHFKWDRGSSENDTKIFVVTETMKFLCFILIVIEIFYIFFSGNDVASFMLLELFMGLEILLLLAGFTSLKNIATGLFLVFAEPFRTGSFCSVLHLQGFVERVSLARTIMRRQDGALVYIPNGIFADAHQTSGSPHDAFQHEIVVRLHTTTPVERIHQARDDLVVALSDLCACVEDETTSGSVSGYRSGNSVSSNTAERRTSAARQSESVVSELETPRKALHIGLCDMDSLKVRLTIDHALFPSLEAAKTEVNLAILKVFESHRIQPLMVR